MKITIAHFYYDLLNLYGENGNVKALKKALEQIGCDVSIRFITIGNTPDFDKYDLIYIGAGTEDNQKIALEHLLQYKKEIKKAIKDKKIFLVTGNALELFGKEIINKKKKHFKALDIFPYYSKEVDFRIVDEALFKTDLIDEKIIGFQNQASVIKDIDNPLFSVISGTGSYPNSKIEGYHKNNFFGTYLIGPILVRNPKLLIYFCDLLLKNKKYDNKYKLNLELEEKAYAEFMNNHYSEYK